MLEMWHSGRLQNIHETLDLILCVCVRVCFKKWPRQVWGVCCGGGWHTSLILNTLKAGAGRSQFFVSPVHIANSRELVLHSETLSRKGQGVAKKALSLLL